MLIIGNFLAVMFETVEPIYTAYGSEFYGFEVCSMIVFSVEVLDRLWAVTEHPEYEYWLWKWLRFVLSLSMIIDFLAIAPYFIGAVVDLRVLRISSVVQTRSL